MKEVNPSSLIPGKVYYIYQSKTTYFEHSYYRGTFVKKIKFGNFEYLLSHFDDVSALKPLEYLGDGNFGKTEIYYDVDKIKENAKSSRQQMEKRAIDIVLKSIICEDFIWY